MMSSLFSSNHFRNFPKHAYIHLTFYVLLTPLLLCHFCKRKYFSSSDSLTMKIVNFEILVEQIFQKSSRRLGCRGNNFARQHSKIVSNNVRNEFKFISYFFVAPRFQANKKSYDQGTLSSRDLNKFQG